MTAPNALLRPGLGFITVEAENTYGMDPASDPIPILIPEQFDPPTPNRETAERNRVKPTGGRDAHTLVDSHVEFSFTTAIAPIPFTDGATPQISPILKGSGLQESTSGGTTSGPIVAEYSPDRRAIGSYTTVMYVPDKQSETDYTKITLTGCRSNIDLDGSPASEILVNVSGQALYAEWQPLADLSSEEPAMADYPSETTFTFQDYTFSFGSVNQNIESWAFDPGFELQQVMSTSPSQRAQEIHLDTVGKEPGGSIDPLAASVAASNDSLDLMKTAGEQAMSLSISEGSSGARTWTFDAPAAQVTEVGFSEADAYYRYDNSYVCNEDTGDDDFKLTWERSS